ncbi:MAG TPA: hypothetical protein VK034_12510 [Enhygromyxa sp.]|nr:hypothetical protein [Enhygromyxa sp.]
MRRRRLELTLIMGSIMGSIMVCRGPLDSCDSRERTAAAVQSYSTIQVIPRVRVGDTIGLELSVHNAGQEPLRVYPLLVSWIGAHERHRFMIRWTDMNGVAIRDPLGFTAGCKGPPGPRRDNVAFVPAGTTQAIELVHGECVTEVLATARPGRYRLWVEYGGPEILRSNVAELEIVGGSPQMWACRDRQLQTAATTTWAQTQPIELLTIADGYLLVFEEEVRGQETGSSSVWLQRLDLGLDPVGPPQRVRGDLDFRLLDEAVAAAVADDRGLVLIADQGRLEAYPLTLAAGELRVDSAREVAFGSDSLVLEVLGSRFVGVSLDGGPVLGVFNHQGELELEKRHPGNIERFTVAPMATGELLVISVDHGQPQPIVVTRFDAAGDPVGVELEFEPDTDTERPRRFAGASVEDGALNLAWVSQADELFYRRFELDAEDPVGSAAPAQRLQPAGLNGGTYSVVFDDSVPVAAWGRFDLNFARADVVVTEIAPSVSIRPPLLAAHGDAFALVWESHESDRSATCQDLHHCATELYGASIGRDGRVRAIRRVTSASQARPYLPDADEWRERCEAELAGSVR